MTDLVGEIRRALRAHADPVRAPGQQAYMKSDMPYLGVTVPMTRRIARSAAGALMVTDGSQLRDAARTLWENASYREERYAAMALLAVPRASAEGESVSLIEHMVRTGQWWDFTDELAHRVADLHDARPAQTASLIRRWSVEEDMWLRRIAIISQLGRRDRVDRDLLAEVIAPNLADREFFIRKAIGWALRDLARVDPDWVRSYAGAHELSPLSRREALKHL